MEKIGSKPIDRLIAEARNGNGLAFTALWDTHINQLRAFIHNWMKNLNDFDVDDICSRSFEKAFRQIGSYDPARSQFITWLKTIAKNTALDFLAAEKRIHPKDQIVYLDEENKTKGMETIPISDENALDTIIKDEEKEEEENYIERLPELYRNVARKRLVDGLRYKEIAEEMDMELNTVKTRIKRAKALIDKMRTDDGVR